MSDNHLNLLLDLKVAKDRKGMAPNKTLLVLAILDLVEAGMVGSDGLVHKDAQLNLRFRSYSPICAPRRGNAIDLNLPFRHLASDGIYTHVGDGERVVRLDPLLLARFMDPRFRQEARRRIVATYFPADEQVALFAALGMPVPSSDEMSEVRPDQAAYKVQLSRGRDARFKVSVISGYHFTCALTGYRLIASKSTYVPLEAAHIHAHAQRGPDTPNNGLALTPTAHDLFDAGLWTIDDNLRIQVAKSDIAESILPGGSHFKLADLDGSPLSFAPQATLRPDPAHLAWHRHHHRKGQATT
jgi:putative restriction endonuclease